jgi:acyl transferase domain-containing protein
MEPDRCVISTGVMVPCYCFTVEIERNQTSKTDHPNFSKPIYSALQVALVDLLLSLGVTARTVVGHSSGEIASAYVGLSHWTLPISIDID